MVTSIADSPGEPPMCSKKLSQNMVAAKQSHPSPLRLLQPERAAVKASAPVEAISLESGLLSH
jgi:hypothetical protein